MARVGIATKAKRAAAKLEALLEERDELMSYLRNLERLLRVRGGVLDLKENLHNHNSGDAAIQLRSTQIKPCLKELREQKQARMRDIEEMLAEFGEVLKRGRG